MLGIREAENGGSEAVSFRVSVDSGVIQMARNPEHLEKGADLLVKAWNISLDTAWAAWDGRKGAIRTPYGDGAHQVRYDPGRSYHWKLWDDKIEKMAFLVNVSREDPIQKPLTLFVGDVGIPYGVIMFPPHRTIAFAWVEPYVLEFASAEE